MDNLPILIRELEKVGYKSPLFAAKKLDEVITSTTLLDVVIEKIRLGMPWEYIVGSAEFKGNSFQVNEFTLIPRIETEQLVDLAADAVHELFIKTPGKSLQIIDIGTGTGCIIISLYKVLEEKYKGKITYLATDISKEALKVAKENSKRILGNENLINFELADILPDEMDTETETIIVSNPPYIPTQEYLGLEKSVVDFEPRSALDGGVEGIDPYVKMLERSKDFKSVYRMLFEIDPSINKRLRELTNEKLGVDPVVLPDQYGIERFLVLNNKEN